jgi:hypothetical protein
MLMVFNQGRGPEEVWVPGGEESEWIARFGSYGRPACTIRQYREWGGFWPRATESADRVMVTRKRRGHRNYARLGDY